MQHTLIAAALYGAVSFGCTQVPLLNYLGFEFAFCIALIGSFIAGFSTIRSVKRLVLGLEGEGSVDPRAAMEALLGSLLVNLVLLLIPLCIMSANALVVKNCSIMEGVGYFLLIPAVSVVFASCVGLCCAAHYHFSTTAFTCFVLATFMYALLLGYFTPAIYSYNFFYGFFPGLTYDEILSISWTLVVFRLITLLAGGFFLWIAWLLMMHTRPKDPGRKKGILLFALLVQPGRRLLTAGIVLLIALLYFFRCQLGFETTDRYIQDELAGHYETDHFTIYYALSSIDDGELRWLAAEHEFRLRQILDVFALQKQERIVSYIYPSAEIKRRFTGAGNTNIAKPWKNQIHLTKQTLDGTLKHELVHIVAGRFGAPVIRASFSTGLVEGLAMAIEWDWGHRTLHQYAAAMRKFGVAPELRPLMSLTGFAVQSSSVSYVLAGSFCRFLIDRYGIRRMAQLYRDSDYTGQYGRTLDELITEWGGFLDRVPVREEDRDGIDVLFRRPPIFGKVCARAVAKHMEQGRRLFAARDYASARGLFSETYRDAKGYDALGGYLGSSLRLADYGSVTAVFDSLMTNDPRPAQYLPLFLTAADAFWAGGNPGKARDLCAKVRLSDISDGLTEAALVRSAALGDEAHRSLFLRYVLFDGDDTARVSLLDSIVARGGGSHLASYLKGKLLLRLGQYESALKTLQASDVQSVERELDAFRCTMIGAALYRLKRYHDAKMYFWISLNVSASEVAVNAVNTWIDRCDWMASHGD